MASPPPVIGLVVSIIMSAAYLFNGEYIKELYAAAVGEYDFTYSGDEVRKGAYEIGIRAERPISDQVKFQLEGYFRN